MGYDIRNPVVTHGECGNTWTGNTRSHCPACHETFNSETAAGLHRGGQYPKRFCIHPKRIEMTFKDGIWRR